jgi:hypothetical protein
MCAIFKTVFFLLFIIIFTGEVNAKDEITANAAAYGPNCVLVNIGGEIYEICIP